MREVETPREFYGKGRYELERGRYRTMEVVTGINTKTIVQSSLEATIRKQESMYSRPYYHMLGPIDNRDKYN